MTEISSPVIVGSRALFNYNIISQFRDIDIICDNETKEKIVSLCGKYIGKFPIYKNNEDQPLVFDIKCCDSGSNVEIYKICNKSNCDLIELIPGIKFIIAPLDVLYVMYKSHVHRILQLTVNQDQNIDIWHEHVKKYLSIRDKLGYQKMDKILYSKESLTEFNSNLKSLFNMMFDETNERYGDTHIDMGKSNNEFFSDNVERFIDHDELHNKVAQMCRGVTTPLYDNFKKNKDSAELDETLFINGNKEDTYQCIREEIIVLFLERKLIPELVLCYKNLNLPPPKCSVVKYKKEIKEIIAHYATNLCGKGHYWLRRYVIDHYHIYSVLDTYNFDDIYQLAIKISGINIPEEVLKYTVKDMIKENDEKGISNSSRDMTLIKVSVSSPKTCETDDSNDSSDDSSDSSLPDSSNTIRIGYGKNISTIRTTNGDTYVVCHNLSEDFVDSHIAKGNDIEVIYYSEDDNIILYNNDTKYGIYYHDSIVLFCAYVDYNKNNAILTAQILDDDGDIRREMEDTCVKKCITLYYESTERCPGYFNGTKAAETSYISTCGNCPNYIRCLFDETIKIHFKSQHTNFHTMKNYYGIYERHSDRDDSDDSDDSDDLYY